VKMLEKHEVTLRASMDLVKISNGILYEPFATPLQQGDADNRARVVVNSNGRRHNDGHVWGTATTRRRSSARCSRAP